MKSCDGGPGLPQLTMVCFCLLLATFVLLFAEPTHADLPTILGVLKSDTVNTAFGYQIVPAGDQNGDGCQDIIITGSNYKAYFYYGGNPLDTVADIVFDSTQRMWNIGDITGDGVDDFAASQRNGNPPMLVYYGGSSFDNVADCWLSSDSVRFHGPVIALGDIDSDGVVEISAPNNLWESVSLFHQDGGCDSLPFTAARPYWTPSFLHYGLSGCAIDYDGDLVGDMATWLYRDFRDSTNGVVYFYRGGSEFDTIPDEFIQLEGDYIQHQEWFGEELFNAGDLNSDGFDDLFVGSDPPDSSNGVYFCGPAFDQLPDVILHSQFQRVASAGDLNSDGYPDLLLSTDLIFAGYVKVYYGGPEMDGEYDYHIWATETPMPTYNFGWESAGLGDVNGDGIDDFAVSSLSSSTKSYGFTYIFSGWQETTGVDCTHESVLPRDYFLDQNYPNPFNSSTTIEFTLPAGSSVTVRIRDILGRIVARPFSGELPAGTHTVTWDGMDADGNVVASGIYIYSVDSGEGSISKKMLFLK